MYRAIGNGLIGSRFLAAGKKASGLLVLGFVLGCDLSGGAGAADPGLLDTGDPLGQCVPSCDGGTCADDGCGGTCLCESGFECDSEKACVLPEVCVPVCDGSRCDDGCGGICECGPGLVCDAQRDCVTQGECADDCADAGYDCGIVCGVDCGDCGADETCFLGKCKSQWASLRLSLEEAHKVSGRVEARLHVDFDAKEGQALPRMVDLRLALEGGSDLQVEAVSMGEPLSNASKSLFTDILTGKPWQVLPDGSVQFLVYSSQNVSELGPGRWLTLAVSFKTSGDAQVRLVRKQGLFAPLSADIALQDSAYDLPITVTP